MNYNEMLKFVLALHQAISTYEVKNTSLESLQDKAIELSGLENFGEDSYLEGLQLLIGEMNFCKKIKPGRKNIFFQLLLKLLITKLLIEETYRTNPDINQVKIKAPIIITGFPRTGSSFIQQLLAINPQFKHLSCWEASTPCPPPEIIFLASDPRIQQFQKLIEIGKYLYPALHELHPVDATRPEECQILFSLEFKSSMFTVPYYLPSYSNWLQNCNMRSAYRAHNRVLRILQFKNPGENWVLKSPTHISNLLLIKELYADSKFIICKRDVESIFLSNFNLEFRAKEISYDFLSPENICAQIFSRLNKHKEIFNLSKTSISKSDIHYLEFDDLVSYPYREVETIYKYFNLNIPDSLEDRINVWNAISKVGNPHNKSHPVLNLPDHSYSLKDIEYK